jgi:hypothetical protein
MDLMTQLDAALANSQPKGNLISQLDDHLGKAQDNSQLPAEVQQKQDMPALYDGKPAMVQSNVPSNMPAMPSELENTLNSLYAGAKAGLTGIGQGAYNELNKLNQGAVVGLNKLGVGSSQSAQDFMKWRQQQEQQSETFNPEGGVGRTVGSMAPYLLAGAAPGGIAANAALGYAAGAGGSNSQDLTSANTQGLQGALIGGSLGAIPGVIQKGVDAANYLKGTVQAANAYLNPAILKNTAEAMIDKGAAGQNVVDALHNHIMDTYAQIKGTSDNLYDNLKTVAQGITTPVPTNNLTLALNSQKAELSKVLPAFQSPSQKAALQDIISKQGDLSGNPSVTASSLMDMRKALNQTVRETDGQQKTTAMSLIGGIDGDINAFAKTPGNEQLQGALQQANNYYKTQYLPFMDANNTNAIKNVVNGNMNMDNMFKTFVKNNAPEAYNSIQPNPELNHIVSAHVLNNSFENAFNLDGSFNPNKFLTGVNKLGSTNDLIQSPDMQQKLQGFATLLKTSDLKDNAFWNLSKQSPMGELLKRGVGAGLGGAVGGPIGAAVGGLAGNATLSSAPKWVASALSSPTGMKILGKAASVNPNTPAAKTLLSSLVVGLVKSNDSHSLEAQTPSLVTTYNDAPKGEFAADEYNADEQENR